MHLSMHVFIQWSRAKLHLLPACPSGNQGYHVNRHVIPSCVIGDPPPEHPHLTYELHAHRCDVIDAFSVHPQSVTSLAALELVSSAEKIHKTAKNSLWVLQFNDQQWPIMALAKTLSQDFSDPDVPQSWPTIFLKIENVELKLRITDQSACQREKPKWFKTNVREQKDSILT